MIAIVDYGMGNLKSVANALAYIGEEAVIAHQPAVVAAAERIILPGVGAFGDAMRHLHERGLAEVLRVRCAAGVPFLGICLGMQLLASRSQEDGDHHGLGLIGGTVVRLGAEAHGLAVPHVGWNDLQPQVDHALFEGLPRHALEVYFVHSFHFVPDDEAHILATCEYGERFVAAVGRDNVIGCQFHPEKSQDNGIEMLEHFCDWEP